MSRYRTISDTVIPTLVFLPFSNKLQTGVTTALGGVSEGMYSTNNLALHVMDKPENVIRNRALLNDYFNSEVIFPNQTHSDKIIVLTEGTDLDCEADAIITNRINQAIGVLTADCVPIMIYDSENQVIGVVHAGWRGVANNIVVKTLEKMRQHYHSKMSQVIVSIGPYISQQNYEVGPDVIEQMPEVGAINLIKKDNNKYLLDIGGVINQQLLDVGVLKVFRQNTCTFETEAFFSARRQGIQSGRFASIMKLK